MKKFGKIFGVAALAVATLTAGVVGLSGCGNKVKVAEIEKYVTSEKVDNTLSDGYKVDISLNGITTKGQVSFKEDGTLECGMLVITPEMEEIPATYSEAYIKEGYLYQRESAEGKYIKTAIDFEDQTSDIADQIAEYTQMADLSEVINEYLGSFKSLEGNGLKVTKTEKSGALEYKMTYKDTTGNMSFVLGYKDNKIEKLSLYMKASLYGQTVTVKMDFEHFTGDVEFPEDLDTNVEIEEEVEEELAA